MKKFIISLSALLVILIFPTFVDAASLTVSSDKSTLPKNSIATVKITLDSNDEINVVQANITYPQDKLKLISTNTSTSAFDVEAPSSASNGNVQVTRAVTGNGIKGNRLVAELKFKAEKESGTATITLKTDSLAIRGSDQKNILETVRNTTIVLSKEPVVASASTQINEDTIPPTISQPQAVNISTNSATIQWTTDELATSTVQYGIDTNYGITAKGNGLNKNHQIQLDPKYLKANTTYFFKVKSSDQEGNEATSPNYTFKTATNSPVAITPVEENIKTDNESTSNNSTVFVVAGILLLIIAIGLFLVKKGKKTPLQDSPADIPEILEPHKSHQVQTIQPSHPSIQPHITPTQPATHIPTETKKPVEPPIDLSKKPIHQDEIVTYNAGLSKKKK